MVYATTANSSMGKCFHVLDLYRKSLLQVEPKIKKPKIQSIETYGGNHTGSDIIGSATQLHEAGIQFKRSKSSSLKDITFSRGILRLPVIYVDDATQSMFLNLMAFERFHIGAGHEISSFIFFMDKMIDNEKDVTLLHSKGIIRNVIGSDKDVAKLFHSLSKDITLDPESSLDAVHRKVNIYCRKPWNEWRANLIQTYFRNPWSLISLFAGILLFSITIGQTVFSVLDYYKPNSPPSS